MHRVNPLIVVGMLLTYVFFLPLLMGTNSSSSLGTWVLVVSLAILLGVYKFKFLYLLVTPVVGLCMAYLAYDYISTGYHGPLFDNIIFIGFTALAVIISIASLNVLTGGWLMKHPYNAIAWVSSKVSLSGLPDLITPAPDYRIAFVAWVLGGGYIGHLLLTTPFAGYSEIYLKLAAAAALIASVHIVFTYRIITLLAGLASLYGVWLVLTNRLLGNVEWYYEYSVSLIVAIIALRLSVFFFLDSGQ